MTQHAALFSSSFTCEWTYDVFLSFRGEDTRTNFTGNLYNSLHQKGIHAFIDDEGLRRGEEITPALFKAIQESRIAIVVFSTNYASSTFCLDELVKILQHLNGEGRLVWPIFYDVDPSEVRHQRGSYGKALAKHEERFQDNKDMVQKWREALHKAANLSGWHFRHGSQSEYKFIERIIEEVSNKINRTPLHVSNYPVGLESSVQTITSLLGLGSNERVSMMGIYGIGGIGKTTIARAVFNSIADQFEGLCFLSDIREKAVNKHGLVQLQETLLNEIVGENDIKLGDINKGIPIIKRRLHRKKVLLILDDVDKLKQLQAIAGGHDWFGSGSRIIITTRDKHLLITHGVVKLYEVKELNVSKSLELFSWNAFKNKKVDPSYVDVSNHVVSYAGGLPLALEVIGSNLCGKRLEEWNSLLDKYERIPNKEVHEILKVSYESLEEDEKAIFLDIACFFNKYQMRYVKEMLYARGFHAEIGIRVLIDKSLIKIDGSNCVRMHDLIHDMGREIVRQESTFEPGKRSRLWSDEEIVHVLEENTGTDKVEVIMLNLSKDQEVKWSGKAFTKMKNLRILIIENARFSRGPKHLPHSLRVLDWSGYPSPSLPSDFNLKKLVILSLPRSCFRLLKPLKMFQSLYFMDFEDCKFLTQVPNLSGLPNLGALCLDNCTNLMIVHDSVGFLDKLVLLTAQGCTQLRFLTSCIRLTSLETLDLRGCSSLAIFPKVLGTMENIREVYLDQTAIKELPFSIGNLIGLERLYLRQCTRLKKLPSSIVILPKLKIIMAYGSQGFQLCGEYENQEKMSSVVFSNVMCLYLKTQTSQIVLSCYLDVYCIYRSHNNIIQVCIPLIEPRIHSLSAFQRYGLELPPSQGTILFNRKDWKSTGSFWFRERFPRIGLCMIGVPGKRIDNHNLVLDNKISVLINGAKQLSCSCNFIFSTEDMNGHIFFCDLKCELESLFSEHEWNHFEVSCELKYHNANGPHWVIANHDGIPTGTLKWIGIHVYKEENNSMEDIRFTNPNISLSQAQMVERDEGKFHAICMTDT